MSSDRDERASPTRSVGSTTDSCDSAPKLFGDELDMAITAIERAPRAAVRCAIVDGEEMRRVLAGVALGKVRGATVADAIVAAFAAQRTGIVYTSDVDDFEALRAFFPFSPSVLRVMSLRARFYIRPRRDYWGQSEPKQAPW